MSSDTDSSTNTDSVDRIVELPPDSLSLSASLGHILSLVPFEDLPSCRLVSRRFYDVIRRNQIAMPRRLLYMKIFTVNTLDCDYLKVEVTKPRNYDLIISFRIHVNRVLLTSSHIKAADKMYRVCSKEAKEYEESDEFEEWSTPLDYQTSSLEEGLRVVLPPLFRRYYFRAIELSRWSDKAFPAEYSEIVADEMLRGKTHCRNLAISSKTNPIFVAKIVHAVNWIHIRLPIDSVSRFLSSVVSIQNVWGIAVVLTSVTAELAGVLAKIIKGWQNGDHRIRQLYLENEKDEDGWPKGELRAVIGQLEPCWRSKETQNTTDVIVRRAMDDVALRVFHRMPHFRMYELVCKDEERAMDVLKRTLRTD